MHRRDFLETLVAGAFALPMADALRQSRAPAKNWAWMKAEVQDFDAWRRQLATLKAAGFDAILMNGDAESYRRYVPLVREEGLELHAWMFTMMRGENVRRASRVVRRQPQRRVDRRQAALRRLLQVHVPVADEGARATSVASCGELRAVDGLASVHLDYIRYPDVILPVALWPKYNLVQDKEYPDFDFCYCDVCRERFEDREHGPEVALADPPSQPCLAAIPVRHDHARSSRSSRDVAHRGGKLLTAAVFPTPAIARTLVRQDWTKWKLDAVLPMIYNGFYKEEVPWVERATREGRAGARRTHSALFGPLRSRICRPPTSPRRSSARLPAARRRQCLPGEHADARAPRRPSRRC